MEGPKRAAAVVPDGEAGEVGTSAASGTAADDAFMSATAESSALQNELSTPNTEHKLVPETALIRAESDNVGMPLEADVGADEADSATTPRPLMAPSRNPAGAGAGAGSSGSTARNPLAPIIHSESTTSVVSTSSAVLGALGVLDRSSSRHTSKGADGGGTGSTNQPAASNPGSSSTKARRSSRQKLDRPRSSSWASFEDYGGYSSSGERSTGSVARQKKKEKKQAKERERKERVVENYHQHYGSGAEVEACGEDVAANDTAFTGTNNSLPPLLPQQQHQQASLYHQQQPQQHQHHQHQQIIDPTDDAAGRPTPPPPPLPYHTQGPNQIQRQQQEYAGAPQQQHYQQQQEYTGAPQQQQYQQQNMPPIGYGPRPPLNARGQPYTQQPPPQHQPHGHLTPMGMMYYQSQTPSPPPSAYVPPQQYTSYSPTRSKCSRSSTSRGASGHSRKRTENLTNSTDYNRDSDDDSGDEDTDEMYQRREGLALQAANRAKSSQRSHGQRQNSSSSYASSRSPMQWQHPAQYTSSRQRPHQQVYIQNFQAPPPYFGSAQQQQQQLMQQGPHGEHIQPPSGFFEQQQHVQYARRSSSTEARQAPPVQYSYQGHMVHPGLMRYSEEKEEEKSIEEIHYGTMGDRYVASNMRDDKRRSSVVSTRTRRSSRISATTRSSKRSSSVRFSTIEIRSYERVLGDNPSCSHGPAVSLGWQYEADPVTVKVDEFEYYRAGDRLDGTALVLSRSEREEILEELGYTRSAIADAVRTNVKVKNNRRQTVHNLPVAKFEEVAENAKRRLKKLVPGKGKKDKEYRKYVSNPVSWKALDGQPQLKSSLRSSNTSKVNGINEAPTEGAVPAMPPPSTFPQMVMYPVQPPMPPHISSLPYAPTPSHTPPPQPTPATPNSDTAGSGRVKKPVIVSEDNSLHLAECDAPSVTTSSQGYSITIGSASDV